MNLRPDDAQARLRWSLYWLFIAVALGGVVGRILAVNAVDKMGVEDYLVSKEVGAAKKRLAGGWPREEVERLILEIEEEARQKFRQQRPFLSANDRSRWATVRALVEHGTYAIDDVIAEPTWDTIDMVEHVGRDGEEHLYSSKPPLMATLMAAPYWVIHKLTGATLGTHPYEIGRFMLVMINVIPLAVYFLLMARFVERFGHSDWGRVFVVAAACFGTFLTTFAVVANNHLHAAVSVAIALHCAWRIWYDGERRWTYFFWAGFFAAFAVTNELPALALLALLAAGLLWKAPQQTLWAYLPAAAIVAAAYFGTNWIAHGALRPPYMHRSETDPADNWYDYTYIRKSDGKEVPSYWKDPVGIDQGEESAADYTIHALVGHHGLFSLTPIWLLSIPGLVMLGRGVGKRRERRAGNDRAAVADQDELKLQDWDDAPSSVDDRYERGQAVDRGYGLWELAVFIAVLSLVCLAFYLSRPQIDRNYGGMTSGLRWMFWFAPLWLMALLPAADSLARSRWGRGFGLVLLGLSVLSVSYPTWNPWTHPWIMDFFLYMGWAAA